MRAGAKLGRTDLQVIVVADAFPVLGLSGWRFLRLGLVSETLGSRDRRGLPVQPCGVVVRCPASGHLGLAHWRQELVISFSTFLFCINYTDWILSFSSFN